MYIHEGIFFISVDSRVVSLSSFKDEENKDMFYYWVKISGLFQDSLAEGYR